MIDDAMIAVRDLLQTSMTTRCATYYVGDIGFPFKNSLPCLMVRERYTEIERASTAKDRYRFGISVLVVTDIVKSFTTAGLTNKIVLSRQKLRKIMEEKDSDGAPMTNTVLGCLMKQSNLRNTNWVYNLNPRVNYQVPSPGEFFYIAAEVTLDLVTDMITRKA